MPDIEPGEWNDPTLLDRLAASSLKITLRDGETTTPVIRLEPRGPEGAAVVRAGSRHGADIRH